MPADAATGAAAVAAPVREALDPITSPAPAEIAPVVAPDWSSLQRWVPAGRLQVRVLRGRLPVPGSEVRLYPQAAWQSCGLDPILPAQAEQRTDGEGLATFGAVAPGEWVVRADDGSQYVLSHPVHVDAAQASRTVLLVFGDGAIDGRACDQHGTPLVGAVVCISGIGPEPVRCVFAATAADGRFAAEGLCEGRYHVQLRNDSRDVANDHMVGLPRGGRATVYFGAAAPMAHWQGSLLDADGAVVPGLRALILRDRERLDEAALQVGADGGFEVRVPAGSYQVLDRRGLDAGEEILRLELGTGATQRDLRWRCLRVVAVIEAEDARHLDAQRAARSLQLVDAAGRERWAEGPFTQRGGTFVQWLVEAQGEYRIRGDGSTGITSTANGTVPVAVTRAAPTRRVVVYLRQP